MILFDCISSQVYSFARAAVKMYHKPSGIKTKNVSSHSSGGWMSKIKVMAESQSQPGLVMMGLTLADTLHLTPQLADWPCLHSGSQEQNLQEGDFPGGLVVKTSPSNAGGEGSIPAQGANIPRASQPKKQNIKQKQYCDNEGLKKSPYQKKKIFKKTHKTCKRF